MQCTQLATLLYVCVQVPTLTNETLNNKYQPKQGLRKSCTITIAKCLASHQSHQPCLCYFLFPYFVQQKSIPPSFYKFITFYYSCQIYFTIDITQHPFIQSFSATSIQCHADKSVYFNEAKCHFIFLSCIMCVSCKFMCKMSQLCDSFSIKFIL